MLDTDSDQDGPAYLEPESETTGCTEYREMGEKSWVDYGVMEFCLVLTRSMDTDKRILKLEAKIKISMEYPLRPPHFALSLYATSSGENHPESDDLEWNNELCAIEAEVNLHILKMLPTDQENYILSHQVCYLAMLFDYYTGEASTSSEKREYFCG